MTNHSVGVVSLVAAALLITLAVMAIDTVLGLLVGSAICLVVGVLLIDWERLTDA